MSGDLSKISVGKSAGRPGPYLARVISHLDPDYMGALEVELLRPVGNSNEQGQIHKVKMVSPFWGQTSANYLGSDNDYNNTQKSYGMWFVPPDVGTTVMVYFIDGDPKRGYWFGCVPDEKMNFSVPGLAATEFSVDGDRVPVAEYNKKATSPSPTPANKLKKPRHPIADVLEKQGLLKDDIRGITTSSSRREAPSHVFGISTPGPLDKAGKTGTIGKKGSEIANAPVSRLGGSTFVMDDGDDKLVRKKPAGEGPPEYASVINGEKGEKKIPHNELIRIRTRTGHQILLHSSEDLIYIGNSKGSTWIELTSNGKVDIYAEDSVSIHSKNDFNFYADRDINLEAGRNINIKSGERLQAEVGKDFNLRVKENGKLYFAQKFNLSSDGEMNIYSSPDLSIKSDASIKSQAASNYNIQGAKVNVKTSGNFNLDAGGDYNLKGSVEYRNAGAYFTIPGGGGVAVVSEQASAANPNQAEKADELPTVDNPSGESDSIKSIMGRIPDREPWGGHENLDPAAFAKDKTDRESNTSVSKPDMFKKYTATVDPFKHEKGSSK